MKKQYMAPQVHDDERPQERSFNQMRSDGLSMNNLERYRKIRDLTRADLSITRFLIWFGLGLVYAVSVILCLIFGDTPSNWSWWAIILLTLAFFVLSMLIQQRFIRYELRALSELPQ